MVQLTLWASALLLTSAVAQSTSKTQVGDRKVGIVIDESNSMQENDPNNTRIDAALALNDALISASEKSSTQLPDQVAVIGFHSSSDLLYPLGDPQGAAGAIKNITSNKWGTFIGGGINEAIDETSKQGTGETSGRTGIVVLTDGQDNSSGKFGVQGTIDAIVRAGSLGIRVSFGFLNLESLQQDLRILTECLRTGGTFSSFSDPQSQKNFIEQVEAQGITNKDGTGMGKTATTLLPGLNTSQILSPNGNPFSYVGRANELLNFTIATPNTTVPLVATLRDPVKNTELAPRQTTNQTGIAVIETTLKEDANVELKVSAAGTYGETIFSVTTGSSLGLTAGRPLEKKNAGEKMMVSWGLLVGVTTLAFGLL